MALPAALSAREPEGTTMAARPRVAWVDGAKGWCILLVVTMHCALGVGVSVGHGGWLHDVVAFAKPFRMPDFFTIAGLFAAGCARWPWRRFVDGKIVHFAYFYVLWLGIALLVKAGELGLTTPALFVAEYGWRLLQPFSTMWFIQLLPLLYLATRAMWRMPALLVAIALGAHVVAALAPKSGGFSMESELTGSITFDAFLLYWIYFVVGARWSGLIFSFAAQVGRRPILACLGLGVWGILEAFAVQQGWPERDGLDLLFGFAGAAAVMVASALIAPLPWMGWLRYLGRHSLVVYLAFFLPMVALRITLLRANVPLDVGTISAVVTVGSLVVPLLLERLLRSTSFAFLFTRPAWARLWTSDDRRATARDVPSAAMTSR